ncbi:unnamed protein product [Cylicocyclus nassatus]|uniref:Uncharacterized protein n=1 Tax=Cylicocyclus nassatus TaxID=53992 RepID=A0AA36DNF2_CYLNA|nr:unnamed protein product [Cylicocyclus nassatus]
MRTLLLAKVMNYIAEICNYESQLLLKSFKICSFGLSQNEPKDDDVIAHITSLLVGLVNKEDKTYTILEFLIPLAEYGAAQLGVKASARKGELYFAAVLSDA